MKLCHNIVKNQLIQLQLFKAKLANFVNMQAVNV